MLLLLLLCSFVLSADAFEIRKGWTEIDDGIEFAEFKNMRYRTVGDSLIQVFRVDPNKLQLVLLAAERDKGGTSHSVRDWANQFNLLLAVNAGMYQQDKLRNLGLMIDMGYINNSVVKRNQYSAIAFNPRNPKDPPFRIFDLDETKLETVKSKYHTVIQNLRLMKRSRRNMWSERPDTWSELAIAEDAKGNALFIFSRAPYSMQTFNEILLRLPLNVQCAAHLEGGVHSQLFSKLNRLHLVGSYNSKTGAAGGNIFSLPIPNVIGVVRKTDYKP